MAWILGNNGIMEYADRLLKEHNLDSIDREQLFAENIL